ncbi:hypothetical protein [Nonomuraea basaltis]|nr:hypothetical protein [Nonomuraea basaltis]
MPEHEALPLAPYNAAALTAGDPPQDEVPQEPGSVVEDESQEEQ